MKNLGTKRLLALLLVVVFTFAQCAVFADDGEGTAIPEQYTWNLSEIYATVDEFNADFDKVQNELIPQLESYKGKLKNSKAIKEALEVNDQAWIVLDELYVYSHCRLDLDQLDYEAAELSGRVASLISKLGAAESFIEPELLSKSERALNMYINSALLKDYKFYLQKLLDRKAHVLSAEAESILASAYDMAESFENIWRKLTIADLDKVMRILPDGTIEYREASWYDSEDRELRRKYFEIGYERYLDVENSLAETLISEVKKNIFFATARKYESAAEAALAGNSIPVEVLNNVVDTIGNNLTALNKYYDLRRRALGLEDLHIYDFGPTIIPGYEAEVSYEDAKTIILEGLKPLGEEYAAVLQKAYDNRWIDVYPGENKYRGAYNISAYTLNPYMLLNYNNTFDSMKTMAHELGHAVHGYWSNASQTYRNASKPPFVAEVASITNELLIMRQAIDNAKDNQEKMALIDMLIADMDGTVFFQIMLQEYEKTLHEMAEAGQGLSTKVLKNLWAELCVKYWGPNFVPDDFYNVRGLNISHFYRGFYVYSYATSFIAAYPISEAVYNNEEGAVDGYIKFLKAGGSDYPVEIIKTMGVDLAQKAPIEAFLAEFEQLVDELERLMIEEGMITAE